MSVTKFAVRGYSMYPAFRPGDILALEPVQPETIRRGNVIVYRTARDAPDDWIMHRVIGFQEHNGHRHFLTRGDNAPCVDMPVCPATIVGRVTGRYENGAVRPIRRREEWFWLALVALNRSFRRRRSKVLYWLSPLLSILFWTGIVRVTRVRVGGRHLALVRGRIVARREDTPGGMHVWVHPLFRRMKRVRLL